ncbi:unnamed protein product [Gordionus sp. m RMFG-2023]
MKWKIQIRAEVITDIPGRAEEVKKFFYRSLLLTCVIIWSSNYVRGKTYFEITSNGKCSLYFLELKDSFNPGEMWKSPHDICMECSCTAEDGFMQTDCKE